MPLAPVAAWVGLFGRVWRQALEPAEAAARAAVHFEVHLPQSGATRLEAWFVLPDGEQQGAYYVTVERLGD